MSDNVYCDKRNDGYRIHEIVEKVNWSSDKIEYYCMWCNEGFNS